MSTTTTGQAGTTKLAAQGERQIRIERIFDAPRALVWRAYTEPELLKQWWGRGNTLVIERMDVRPGGHWRFVEHAGGESHGFEGRYGEVTPPERIEQTFEWDGMPAHVSLDRVEFIDLGDGRTKVVTTGLFMTREDCESMLASGMEQGLSESYDALDRLLAKMR